MRVEKYILVGMIIVKGWYNQIGYKYLEINTTLGGLKKIKKDPLQDYINYGAQEVLYAHFDVYHQVHYNAMINNKVYSGYLTSDEPIDTIEAGVMPKGMTFDFDDVVKINY